MNFKKHISLFLVAFFLPLFNCNSSLNSINNYINDPLPCFEPSEKKIDPVIIKNLQSCPTDKFPWDKDPEFTGACKKNDTGVFMAGYKTVLHDPLPGEEYNVHLAAKYLSGTVLKPGQVFSQNNYIGPYIESRGFKIGPTYAGTNVITTVGGGVCKIASTVYNVAIMCDLQIVSRYCHSLPVPYVPYGQDATVSYGSKDIKFRNNTDYTIMIWAKGVDNTLYIAFYGKKKAPKSEWSHEFLNVTHYKTVYKINPKLPDGTEKIIMEGMDGATIRSSIKYTYPDGTTKERKLGLSSYEPIPLVIEKSK